MYRWRRTLIPYLFISPFFLGYAIFCLYPMLSAPYLSLFKQVGIGTAPRFVGVDNYANMLSDQLFQRSLLNTTYYAAGSIFIIVPAALILALALTRRNLVFREGFRVLYFSPNITAGIVVAIIFGLVFDEKYGLLNNYILAPSGIPPIRWLNEPDWIMPAIRILGLWRYVGINALYFMTGLQNIPEEIKEAARIDGANHWQLFRFVLLPLLRPILIFVLTFAIIGSYNLFTEPTILVGVDGGVRNAGLFMTMYLYLTGFRFLDFGYAAAIGWAMAVIILVLTTLQLLAMRVFQED